MAMRAPPNVESPAPLAGGDGAQKSIGLGGAIKQLDTPHPAPSQKLTALLHPPARGVPFTGLYGVSFRGEMIVRDSRNPECDLARALLDRGIDGIIKVIDANTGRHQTTVDVESAAKLTVREDRTRGPEFVKWRPMPETAHQSDAGKPYAGERASPVSWHPERVCPPTRRAAP